MTPPPAGSRERPRQGQGRLTLAPTRSTTTPPQPGPRLSHSASSRLGRRRRSSPPPTTLPSPPSSRLVRQLSRSVLLVDVPRLRAHAACSLPRDAPPAVLRSQPFRVQPPHRSHSSRSPSTTVPHGLRSCCMCASCVVPRPGLAFAATSTAPLSAVRGQAHLLRCWRTRMMSPSSSRTSAQPCCTDQHCPLSAASNLVGGLAASAQRHRPSLSNTPQTSLMWTQYTLLVADDSAAVDCAACPVFTCHRWCC